MTKAEKTLERVLRGTADAAISFEDLVALLRALGFGLRIRGDHRILWREEVPEILNLQPGGGSPSPTRSARSGMLS